MAVAQYFAWDRAGRPLNPAQPIRELVNQLKVAYPKAAAAAQFSWYADEAHYQADYPEDHTPYSYTGWPIANPYPYVFATDVMHRPDLGVNCDVLFAYWLSEAKAGRMPWLKYLIYKRKLYHVRLLWAPVDNSGHDTHIHVSARTDHLNTGLGGWSAVPQSAAPPSRVEDDMWLITAPSRTVYLAPGDLVDGKPVVIPQTDYPRVLAWRAAGVRDVTSTVEPKAPHFFVTAVNAAWPPPEPPVEVDLSDEDLEKLAAKVGEVVEDALPTREEAVQIAKEGANLAEDS